MYQAPLLGTKPAFLRVMNNNRNRMEMQRTCPAEGRRHWERDRRLSENLNHTDHKDDKIEQSILGLGGVCGLHVYAIPMTSSMVSLWTSSQIWIRALDGSWWRTQVRMMSQRCQSFSPLRFRSGNWRHTPAAPGRLRSHTRKNPCGFTVGPRL